MTRKQLQELLDQFPEDAIITFAEPTHDHWGTVKARKVTEANLAYTDNDGDIVDDDGCKDLSQNKQLTQVLLLQ